MAAGSVAVAVIADPPVSPSLTPVPSRSKFIASSVTRFGMAGLVAVIALGGLTLYVVSGISTSESLNAAKERARLAGHGIVEPALQSALLADRPGSDHALAALDAIVQTRVLSERVVRVKIWSPDGRIIYSDEPRLIGAKYAPKPDHAEVMRNGGIRAELSNMGNPENRLERDSGPLLEVYLPVRAPNGQALVYEQYETYDTVTGSSRRLLRRLALPLGAGLALLWLTQLPLARSLVRRTHAAEAERSTLLERAVTASERERERIAADLHDGVVQDLAGLTFELSALGATMAPGDTRDAVDRSADIARHSMQRLRSSLVDLHPPAVHVLGLEEAIDAAAEPLRRDGITVDIALEIPDISLASETLIYRNVQELLRNVHEHAHATHASVTADAQGESVRVRVADNGTGFTFETHAERLRAGHLGIELQRALITRAGGSLWIESAPGTGTIAMIELPR